MSHYAECRVERRHCRRLERRCRRSLSILMDGRYWVEATRRRFALCRMKNKQYWNDRLLHAGHSSQQLGHSMNERHRHVSSSTLTQLKRLLRFSGKRLLPLGHPPLVHNHFRFIVKQLHRWLSIHGAQREVRRIIMASITKSCSLDPVPTFSLREFTDILFFCRSLLELSTQR